MKTENCTKYAAEGDIMLGAFGFKQILGMFLEQQFINKLGLYLANTWPGHVLAQGMCRKS